MTNYKMTPSEALVETLVAEGVETEEQAEYLKSIGCDSVQGYFFSKPLPLEEVIAYLEGMDY